MPPARIVFYAATAAALLLTFRAVFLAPPPLGWAIIAAAGYVALVLASVFVLRLRVFVDAVVRGPRGARGVALTFDDGPDATWTRRVLDLLDGANAKATFFVIGRKAEAEAELTREIVARGHTLGVHSYAHDRLFSLRSERRVREDLERAIAVLEKITGARPTLFRPPIGHTNPTIARVADALDLTVIGWTIGARDGMRGAQPDDVVARVRTRIDDGAIVLLHDAAEAGDYEPAGPRALPQILSVIAKAKLPIVPLARWLGE